MGCIALVRCVLVLRCGSAGVVWYPYAGWGTSASATHSRKLLKMNVLAFETWWAKNKASDISRSIFIQPKVIFMGIIILNLRTEQFIFHNHSPFYSNAETGKVSIVTVMDLYRRWPWYTSNQNTVHLGLSNLPGGKGHKVARGSLPGLQLVLKMKFGK